MEIAIIASASSLLGVLFGGIISYFIQNRQLKHELQLHKEQLENQLKIKLEDNKTENIAELTAKYYMQDEGFIERSFDHLKTKLGGFEDDELRKILVRAGAVRFFRENENKEFWCLVKNLPEKYKRDREKRKLKPTII